MTATIDPTTSTLVVPSGAPASARPSLGDRLAALPVWRVSALAGLVAAVAATAVAGLAEVAGVPMEAAEKSAATGEHIPLYGYAMSTLMAVAVGTVIAAVLHRKASHPGRTFTIVAVALTLASFALPHTTGHATTATRLVLDLTHVVVAAIVIPVVAARLDRRPATAPAPAGS
jgi:hypothetical protein